MTVTIVAAVATNGVIGSGPDIPWRIKGDQKRAKELTMGHVLIMGRKTYESIGRPLPGRTTIVVTRDASWAPARAGDPTDAVHTAPSVDDALRLARDLDDEIFVYGGAEIYSATLPIADRLEITEVHVEPEGDIRFPDVDWSQWRESSRDEHEEFTFVSYTRA